jgi:hypothetical protein
MKNAVQLLLFLTFVHFANAWANEDKDASGNRNDDRLSESSAKPSMSGPQCESAKIKELAEWLASANCTVVDETHLKRAESILCRPKG